MTLRLRNVLDQKSVAVVAGSGGVGKTTIAAAIALQAALHTDKRVLVITVDPARRLADALGIAEIGDTPTQISGAAFADTGFQLQGELWAAMLDTKQAWDDLVRRHAPDEKTAQAILTNKLYGNISGRFVQSHDYIAMERLFELHEEGLYDLIVVDTPPSSHAADLLDAPQRLADFFDSRLLKFLIVPSRSRLVMLTAKPFMQLADRLLGKRFLSDISEFFTLLESMRPGFIERAEKVKALLASSESVFTVVTTLESAAVREATALIDELIKRDLDLGAVIANRVLPEYLAGGFVTFPKQNLQDNVLSCAKGDPVHVKRVFAELLANGQRLGHLADLQQQESTKLSERAKILGKIPWLEGELRSLQGLTVPGEMVW